VDTHQFNTLGGICELIGVGFVAWDLMGLARYRGILKQVAARFRAWRTKVVVAVRRLLRRPAPSVAVHAGTAAVTAKAAGTAAGRAFPGRFVAQPDEPLEDQVVALAGLMNRLRDEVIKEPQERDQAISAEREARRKELRAEAERLQRLVAEARQEVKGLQEVTTGNLRLRAEGLYWLVAGIVFTTWSELSWLPFRLTAFAVGTIFLARVSWPCWSWLAKNQAGRPARLVGPGVPWPG
jgi:hypothetical protein